MSVESVVCVPGPWQSREDLMRAVMELPGEDGPRFVLAGVLMMELVTEDALELEWHSRDPSLARAFTVAGRGALDADELAAIDAAPGHVFLIDRDAGSLQSARRVMIFAEALLRAGGLGVKVESAGVAHGIEAWRAMTSDAHDVGALLAAYLAFVGDPSQGFFTCGMHNLGLPDAVVPPGLEPERAVDLLETFALYLAAEQPQIEEGQTFAVAEDAPVYELAHQPCAHFPADDPFHNPIGLWALLPVEGPQG